MTSRRIPASTAFDAIAAGAQFRDTIVLRTAASGSAIFDALRAVTLSEMPLARLFGELRYLPLRLLGRRRGDDLAKPFLSILIDGGTLVLRDDAPREVITGSAGRLHRIVDQTPVRFTNAAAFDAFDDPGHEKLFMSIRIASADTPGESWLVLEHATRALSADAERKFARYWRVIKPAGAFVTRQLLKAIDRRARATAALAATGGPEPPSVSGSVSTRAKDAA
jgi:hypothetical protein